MLISLLDFIDRFGANTRVLDEEMIAFAIIVSDANSYYLNVDFEDALSVARLALEKQEYIQRLSLRIKNQTLFWVYLAEWSIVTGTGLITGTILWPLMIRRHLYRKVSGTRMRRFEY